MLQHVDGELSSIAVEAAVFVNRTHLVCSSTLVANISLLKSQSALNICIDHFPGTLFRIFLTSILVRSVQLPISVEALLRLTVLFCLSRGGRKADVRGAG